MALRKSCTQKIILPSWGSILIKNCLIHHRTAIGAGHFYRKPLVNLPKLFLKILMNVLVPMCVMFMENYMALL